MDWSIPDRFEWDDALIDINQILIPIEGPIITKLPSFLGQETDEHGVQYEKLTLHGPVTLHQFVVNVNRFYREHMLEHQNTDDIQEILGHHMFPEALRKETDDSYMLSLGS